MVGTVVILAEVGVEGSVATGDLVMEVEKELGEWFIGVEVKCRVFERHATAC